MSERQLISNLLSALEYHAEQTRPIEFSRAAVQAAHEYLQKPAQQQEPVCNKDPQGCWSVRCQLGKVCKNKYTPASKPWVGLTDDEIKRMAAPLFMSHYWNLCNELARAIEAKLREKNT